MNLHFSALVLFVLLLNRLQPQNIPTEPTALPAGVLTALVPFPEQYCEDQFGDRRKRGCGKQFASHLKWMEVVVAPTGETGILIENQNQGFCGTAGCSLYLVVKADGTYAQVLGRLGDVGTLKRFVVLKETTKGHFNVQIAWSDGQGHSNYRWNGSRYATQD
jgi:hypothetical protein